MKFEVKNIDIPAERQQQDQQENMPLAQKQSSVLMAELTENLLWEQQGMIIALPRWATD